MIFASSPAFPQPMSAIVEGDENWVTKDGVYYGWFFYVRPDRYSASDVAGFREKFRALKSFDSDRDWSGAYFSGTEQTVDHMKLLIDSDRDYAEFSVYTCLPELRYIDFGTVVETDEFIQLVPDRPQGSTRKTSTVKYVKVRWGERRVLVEESSIKAFAEKAVGVYVEPEDESAEDRFKWANFLVLGEHQVEQYVYQGLPEFPGSYKKFQRLPIRTHILSAGKRLVVEDEAVYLVRIAAGRGDGVKVGLRFEIPDTGDQIEITRVHDTFSVGKVRFPIDQNGREECVDLEYRQIACPKLEPKTIVQTQVGQVWGLF
jgi:hypothetical protein